MKKGNARRKNGARRDKLRARLAAEGRPCHICGQPIDYSIPYRVLRNGRWIYPDDAFEVDEICPVSRFYEYGYDSPEQAALDFSNLAPAHRKCNRLKSNKLLQELKLKPKVAMNITHSRDW